MGQSKGRFRPCLHGARQSTASWDRSHCSTRRCSPTESSVISVRHLLALHSHAADKAQSSRCASRATALFLGRRADSGRAPYRRLRARGREPVGIVIRCHPSVLSIVAATTGRLRAVPRSQKTAQEHVARVSTSVPSSNVAAVSPLACCRESRCCPSVSRPGRSPGKAWRADTRRQLSTARRAGRPHPRRGPRRVHQRSDQLDRGCRRTQHAAA